MKLASNIMLMSSRVSFAEILGKQRRSTVSSSDSLQLRSILGPAAISEPSPCVHVSLSVDDVVQ